MEFNHKRVWKSVAVWGLLGLVFDYIMQAFVTKSCDDIWNEVEARKLKEEKK